MKYPSFARLIAWSVFFRNCSLNFFVFLHEDRESSNMKVMKLDFMIKMIWWDYWAKTDLNEVFQDIEVIASNLPDFFCEVTVV